MSKNKKKLIEKRRKYTPDSVGVCRSYESSINSILLSIDSKMTNLTNLANDLTVAKNMLFEGRYNFDTVDPSKLDKVRELLSSKEVLDLINEST